MKDKFKSAEYQDRIEKANKLENVAKDWGMSLTNLALGWCLQNSNVSTVILGASTVEQLKENLKTMDYAGSFSGDLMNQIESIVQTIPK